MAGKWDYSLISRIQQANDIVDVISEHLNLEKKEDNLVIIITDYNVQRFNPNETDLYDTSSDLDTRPVGKIGIHLIKKMIDEIDYTYKDHNSIITLTKHIGSSHV